MKRFAFLITLLTTFVCTQAHAEVCITAANSTSSVSFSGLTLWGANQEINGQTNAARTAALNYAGTFACAPDAENTDGTFVFCTGDSFAGLNLYTTNYSVVTDPVLGAGTYAADLYETTAATPGSGTLVGHTRYYPAGYVLWVYYDDGSSWRNAVQWFGTRTKTCKKS